MVKPITLEQAKKLKSHQTIYMIHHRNSDGTAVRWRVNGMPKTWKTRPNEVQVPLKHGLYDYGYLDQHNLHEFSLTKPEAVKKGKK